MATQFERFKETLEKMLMLDQADLDFGIYRIMNQKRTDIEKYLNNNLKRQVADAVSNSSTAEVEAVKKEINTLVKTLSDAGVNPEDSPKVKELRAKLAEGGDTESLENEVYSHLTTFFSRYYDGGDFISQRRYKKDVYAIPYEGEEVKLHWANADQYYIKTSEYFRSYRFTLRSGKAVEFTLKEASSELNNNRAQNNMERRFALYEEKPIEVVGDTLHINFRYELYPKTENQKDFIVKAYDTVKDSIPSAFMDVLELKPTDKDKNRTLLQKHLNDYVARNTFDYFIHKDLYGFLTRELDFYIKNEILVIDDIDAKHPKDFVQHLSVIKAIKTVGNKIITFLASLENFQKKLWLKKKFVVQADYCITLDRVPEELYPEICKNDKQREEWVNLFAINKIVGDLSTEAYSEPLTEEFLNQNPHLVLDTAHFPNSFKYKLLSSFDNVEEGIKGLLVNSENFHALRLLKEKYAHSVKCVYIDPPYNTGDDGFAYKDCFQESSWMTCIDNRLDLSKPYFKECGSFTASIDINELDKFTILLDKALGKENRKANITVRRASITGAKVINPGPVNISENVIIYSNGVNKWKPENAYRERDYDNRYGKIILNPQDNYEKWQFGTVLEEFAKSKGIIKSKLRKELGDKYNDELLRFVIEHREQVIRLAALDENSVGSQAVEFKKQSLKEPNRIFHIQRDDANDYYIIKGNTILFYKDRIRWMGDGYAPIEKVSDIWDDVLPNDLHNEGGVKLKKGKKPEKLINRILESTTNEGEWILDYFAGSATSGAVAMKSKRKFINVEANEYFDQIPLRRLKNTLAGEKSGITKLYQWKGGGCFKYIRLEQYEDTLNNLVVKSPMLADDNGEFYDGYVLGYLLDTEAKDSLFNLEWFRNPWKTKLFITHQNETKEETIDLVETFNYLIGLNVKTIRYPKDGICTVEGETRTGERTLVIWRNVDEIDNESLNTFFEKQAYPTKDSEFDRIYVNGDNNLENLRSDEELQKVVLIEKEFAKRMFEDC